MISWCGRRFGRGRSGLAAVMAMLTAMLGAAGLRAGPGERAKAPASPEEAVRRITLPPGFKATLFAGEPDVVQPIAFTFDPRAGSGSSRTTPIPIWLGGPQGKDRILIFEDTDGDGQFDHRTVFYDKGTNLTGIELGFGGVWVCATPNLLFIPDRDGDDQPDGPPGRRSTAGTSRPSTTCSTP